VWLWWGVETLLERQLPRTVYTGTGLLVSGLVVLKLVNRLGVNLGLTLDSVDDDSTAAFQIQLRSTPTCTQHPVVQNAMNAAELIAVVSIWTGLESFCWSSVFIQETVLRNACYTAVGFTVLLATDTFVNLAGMMSKSNVLHLIVYYQCVTIVRSVILLKDALYCYADTDDVTCLHAQ
jgi:hypothetical protein